MPSQIIFEGSEESFHHSGINCYHSDNGSSTLSYLQQGVNVDRKIVNTLIEMCTVSLFRHKRILYIKKSQGLVLEHKR